MAQVKKYSVSVWPLSISGHGVGEPSVYQVLYMERDKGQMFHCCHIGFQYPPANYGELTHPAWGIGDDHLQECLGRGYVSSLQGIQSLKLT